MSHNLFAHEEDDENYYGFRKNPQQEAQKLEEEEFEDSRINFELYTWPRILKNMKAGKAVNAYDAYDARMYGSYKQRQEVEGYRKSLSAAKNSAASNTVTSGLEISQPGDASELQADAVANAVVSGGDATALLESSETTSSVSPQTQTGSPQTTTPEFDAQLQASKGSGQQLDESTRSNMEAKMGTDLSGVKIHTDSNAQEMADAVNAKAFTHGEDVYFGSGYSPGDTGLLAHELAHVGVGNGGIQRKENFYARFPTVNQQYDGWQSVRLDADGDSIDEIELWIKIDFNFSNAVKVALKYLGSGAWSNHKYFMDSDTKSVNYSMLPYQELGIEVNKVAYKDNTSLGAGPFYHELRLFDKKNTKTQSHILTVYASENFHADGKHILTLGDKSLTFVITPSKINKQEKPIEQIGQQTDNETETPTLKLLLPLFNDEVILQVQKSESPEVNSSDNQSKRPYRLNLMHYVIDPAGGDVGSTDVIQLAAEHLYGFGLNLVRQDEQAVYISLNASMNEDLVIHFHNHVAFDKETNQEQPQNRTLSFVFSGPAVKTQFAITEFRYINNDIQSSGHYRGKHAYEVRKDLFAPTLVKQQYQPTQIAEDIGQAEGVLMALLKQLVDAQKLPAKLVEAWNDYSYSRLLLQTIAYNNDPKYASQRYNIIETAAKKADEFAKLYDAEVAPFERTVTEHYEHGMSSTYQYNEYASYVSQPGEKIRARKWGDAAANFKNQRSVMEKYAIMRAGDKDKPDSIAASIEQWSTMRNHMEEMEGKQYLQKVKAVFYPDDSLREFNAGTDAPQLAVPLQLWAYVEEGEWFIRDLIGRKPFITDGYAYSSNDIINNKATPPLEAFALLNHEDHLPEGEIYYERAGQLHTVQTEGETLDWWDVLSYVGMGLALIGLTIATMGTAAPAAVALFGTICIYGSAAATIIGTAGSLYDDYTHDQLDSHIVLMGALDIVTSLLQIKTMALGSVLRTESVASKFPTLLRAAENFYVPLKIAEYGTQGVQILVMTADTVDQVKQILDAPGDDAQKQRSLLILISQSTVSMGMFVMDLRGAPHELDLVQNSQKKIRFEEIDGQLRMVPDDGVLPDTPVKKAEPEHLAEIVVTASSNIFADEFANLNQNIRGLKEKLGSRIYYLFLDEVQSLDVSLLRKLNSNSDGLEKLALRYQTDPDVFLNIRKQPSVFDEVMNEPIPVKELVKESSAESTVKTNNDVLRNIEESVLDPNGNIDPVKLRNHILKLRAKGVQIITGAQAEEILKKYKANAMYIPGDPGKPGALVLRETADRTQIIEELMHLEQHRIEGFRILSSDEIITMEIDAHEQMIDFARDKGWTKDEIDKLETNKKLWEDDKVKYDADEKFREKFDAEHGGFKNRGDVFPDDRLNYTQRDDGEYLDVTLDDGSIVTLKRKTSDSEWEIEESSKEVSVSKEEILKRLPEKYVTTTTHTKKLYRSGKSGGMNAQDIKKYKTKESIPEKYQNVENFDYLASDPDQGGAILPKTRVEAMSGIEAVNIGAIPPPISRGPKGIEFYDGHGNPWDVKTPPSPKNNEFEFNANQSGQSIQDELRIKGVPPGHFFNSITGLPVKRGVILNSTFMNAADHKALWDWLNSNLTQDELSRIIEVITEV